MELYYLILWPDSQGLEGLEGFEENCYPCESGSVFASKEWYDKLMN